jgi:phosphoribosylformylglycinamidine synthase
VPETSAPERSALDTVALAAQDPQRDQPWAELGLKADEYARIREIPQETPVGKLLAGTGENAGVLDIGQGYAVTFKVESHNHPSYVEPYQGAATGVGGIVRDILAMGARPVAVMDPLRFGPLDAVDSHRVVAVIVAGVGV